MASDPPDTVAAALAKAAAAFATLENLGYTYTGGTLWKPPLATHMLCMVCHGFCLACEHCAGTGLEPRA